ncbi:MAG: hypothetical protein LBH53_03000 [Puniceicoccales bacterium]|jgi:hypothetical protein|nr:hypothetical protein [Puniceicoccales bacterium]
MQEEKLQIFAQADQGAKFSRTIPRGAFVAAGKEKLAGNFTICACFTFPAGL